MNHRDPEDTEFLSSGPSMRASGELNLITREVIGAAIEVHRHLGPGYLESVYEEAMCAELRLQGIPFARQVVVAVGYKGLPVGESRLDLLVRGCVLVELKAVEALSPLHTAQVLSYLRMTGHEVALLINFNVPILSRGIKRLVL